MGYGYGPELRYRVVRAYERGLSARKAGERFEVPVATAVRWCRLWRQTGSPMDPPRRLRGSALDPHAQWLVALRRAEANLRLVDIAERLEAEHGVKTDKSALSRFFAKQRITFKKNALRQ